MLRSMKKRRILLCIFVVICICLSGCNAAKRDYLELMKFDSDLMNCKTLITSYELDYNIIECICDDKEQFRVWTEEGLRQVDFIYTDGVELIPIEVHHENYKYAGIYIEPDTIVFFTSGSMVVYRDGRAVDITAHVPINLNNKGADLAVYHALGISGIQICISAYSTGSGYCKWNTIVFDVDSMQVIEVEKNDERIVETVKQYLLSEIGQSIEIKEGYGFYLSDSFNDALIGFRPQVEGQEKLSRRLSVFYSPKALTESLSVYRICYVNIDYEYSPKENRIIMGDITFTP